MMVTLTVFLGSGIIFAEPPLSATDSTGATVTLPRIPQRVVSLAPSLSELVFDLEAGSSLVGRTSRCNFPEEARNVTDIGGYMTPDFEKLLTVKPELVLATKNGMRSELIQRIKTLGIAVYVDDSSSIDEIEKLIKNVGILLGKTNRAEQLCMDIESRREKIRALISRSNIPTVLFVVGINPLIVASSSSFVSSLISEAGGINVVNDLKIQFPKFSVEEVIRKDPDVIFMLDKECHGVECQSYWKNYGFLKAVSNKRVYEVDSDLVSRPGTRIIDALERLTGHLHPEAASFIHSALPKLH